LGTVIDFNTRKEIEVDSGQWIDIPIEDMKARLKPYLQRMKEYAIRNIFRDGLTAMCFYDVEWKNPAESE
jgi:hypothetical protein